MLVFFLTSTKDRNNNYLKTGSWNYFRYVSLTLQKFILKGHALSFMAKFASHVTTDINNTMFGGSVQEVAI